MRMGCRGDRRGERGVMVAAWKVGTDGVFDGGRGHGHGTTQRYARCDDMSGRAGERVCGSEAGVGGGVVVMTLGRRRVMG
jgi:hypothetical protein